jgi:hypothetical protein
LTAPVVAPPHHADVLVGGNVGFGNNERSTEEIAMNDMNTTPGGPRRDDESSSWSDQDSGDQGRANAREWMTQLQSMIDNLATNAAPVIREIGAKAAELAALAGEKAGPIAHKAADVTATAGSKVAERGREVAAELRRDAGRDGGSGSGTASSMHSSTSTATIDDRPDTLGE